MHANKVTKNQLIIFARVPQSGKNKTRLIPALGPEKATEIYRLLARKTLDSAAGVRSIPESLRVSIVFTGGSLDEARAAFGQPFQYASQCGDTLGDRLKFAVSAAFDSGAQKVVVIGTDCPELTSVDLETAFGELGGNDLVLGPALDGGYYLIGIRSYQPRLFEEVEWSTQQVYDQTLERAKSLNLKVHSLRSLSDVDYPEDLIPLRNCKERQSCHWETIEGRLSIIIPTLNEAANLKQTLEAIGQSSDHLEIIVVDGGSGDATLSIAKEHGCDAFVVNRGRANQLNAGAAVATGDRLMFLHADTQLPEDYRHEIDRILATEALFGAFPLKVEGAGIGLRIVEVGVSLRCKYFNLPYGDQAIFLRATDFFELGGFKPMAIMEDYEFVARIRKLGQVGMANIPVRTSDRRWKRKGIFKTTVVNQICLVMYKLGWSDMAIARMYRGRP